MKFGVLIFPGSNCDHDAFWTIQQVAKQPVTFLWHESHDLQGCDAIIVPGGFAYGDYLRTGAIAKFSPVMESVRKFADGGGSVLGICNGFQILCESGLLPGALTRNTGLKYVCKPVNVRVENADLHPEIAKPKRKIDRSGRLADTALARRDRDDRGDAWYA